MKTTFVTLVSLFLITACKSGDLPAQHVIKDVNSGYIWLYERVNHLYKVRTGEAVDTYYDLYKSKRSDTCYLKISKGGNRMTFSVVPCKDWE